MDEPAHDQGRELREAAPAASDRNAMALVSDAERDFWRRAVAAERARQRCGRPVPFPFQST